MTINDNAIDVNLDRGQGQVEAIKLLGGDWSSPLVHSNPHI